MPRLHIFLILLILTVLSSACSLEATNPLAPTATSLVLFPTATLETNTNPTSAPLPATPVPINTGGSTGGVVDLTSCVPLASASGLVTDIDQVESLQARTLPNGRRFPGRAPVQLDLGDTPVQNTVLIQFTQTSTQQERNDYLQSIGGQRRQSIDSLATYVVTLRPNTNLSSFPPSPIVLRIEPEYQAGAAQINDPRYGEQWSFPVVGLPDGWSRGTGQPVTVAVVDSGVCLAHPDLVGRITVGYDFVENDATPQDDFGHGCGVAGVIAAVSNNGVGIAGIAPNVQIMPLRVLDRRGVGGYAAIAGAIVYAADNGADIINLSLAGSSYSQVLADSVNYAVTRGVVIIAAAGNFGSNNVFYPAAFPNVIAVGSVDNTMQRSNFSNYGTWVDIYAPGRDILTTSINGDYQMQTGTSFAAPIVAGLTAITHDFVAGLNDESHINMLRPRGGDQDCVSG